MAERIGHVLYWLGCVVAVLMAAAGVLGYATQEHGAMLLCILLVMASVPWLAGRAMLYILANR